MGHNYPKRATKVTKLARISADFGRKLRQNPRYFFGFKKFRKFQLWGGEFVGYSECPKYIEGVFGSSFLPAVRFDGVDDFLIASGLSIISKQITVFMVAKRRAVSYATGGLSFILSSASTDYNNNKSFVAFDESAAGLTLQTFSNSTALSIASHPGTGIAYIVETVFDGTKNTVYLNGVASPSANVSSVFEIDKIYIGVRSPYMGYYNGDIAEIIVFSRVLKTEDRKLVEKYLSKKYSIKIS